MKLTQSQAAHFRENKATIQKVSPRYLQSYLGDLDEYAWRYNQRRSGSRCSSRSSSARLQTKSQSGTNDKQAPGRRIPLSTSCRFLSDLRGTEVPSRASLQVEH